MAEADPRTPIERRIERSLEDTDGAGKPLSRRARQTKRTVEAYLKAGGVPRYMERRREIDGELAILRLRLERSYRAVRRSCGGDAELFAERWLERVNQWPYERLNTLIREHNEWYP